MSDDTETPEWAIVIALATAAAERRGYSQATMTAPQWNAVMKDAEFWLECLRLTGFAMVSAEAELGDVLG